MPDVLLESILGLFEKNFNQRANWVRALWDYFDGDQAKFLQKFDGESTADYSKRISRAVIENQCGPTVDIPASRIYGTEDGKDPVSRRALSEEANKFLHDNVYENNHMPSFMMGHSLQLGVTGTSVIHIVPWDIRTNKPFDISLRTADRRKFGTIRYLSMNTESTIPITRIGSEPDLGAIVRRYIMTTAVGDTMMDRMIEKVKGRTSEFEVIEYIDDNSWIKWKRPVGSDDDDDWVLSDPIVPASGKSNRLSIENFPNVYKSVSVPFIIFKNMGRPFEIEGVSDLRNVISLQNNLNESINDDMNVLRHHAFPIPKFMNGAKAPTPLVFRHNTYFEFDEEGQDVDFLQWDGNLEASMSRQKASREQIAFLSQVGVMSRGNTDMMGQVRSQPAIRILFAPDLMLMKHKIPYIIKGEKWLLESTLKMWEWFTDTKFENYDSEIILPKDVIGYDELLQAQTDQMNLQAGIKDIEDILRIEHPDKTPEEISAMAKELEESKMQSNNNNFGNMNPNNQVIAQGEK